MKELRKPTPEKNTNPPSHSGRILIADDDANVLQMTRRLLAQAGYDCDCVADASQAADLLVHREYDLLISDVEMPGNNDLSLIREVARIAGELPIIIMTGHPTVENAVRSMQLTVAAYLVKPFERELLLANVERAIRGFHAVRTVQNAQNRVEEWGRALAAMTTALQAHQHPGTATWRTLFNLTVRNIRAELNDLATFAEFSACNDAADNISEPSSLSSPGVLINAIRETISVLEKTKNTFRSRELGDLRRKLEILINQTEN